MALLAAAPASAQTPYEIAALGPRHAAEHAAARAAAAQPVTRAAEVPDAAADVVGRWSSETVALPTYAINSVLLPTGKVAFWGRPPLLGGKRENLSQFWLWDPVTGGLSRHDAPPVDLDGDGDADAPAPLFCSGQSLLADGQLFVAGGNLGNPADLGGSTPNWRGLDRAYTFDPWTLKWVEQPRPRHGRWYPVAGRALRRADRDPRRLERGRQRYVEPGAGGVHAGGRARRHRPDELPPGGRPLHRLLPAPVHAPRRACLPRRPGPRRHRRAGPGGAGLARGGQRLVDRSAGRTATASAATRSSGRRACPATCA